MDKLTPERRSENMRRITSKGTKPELLVRSLAHRMGYRYRLHRKDLPGKPDLVFPGKRKVIFVHGCFWHQHEKADCLDSRIPKSNLGYWRPKLERNVRRDIENQTKLREMGWESLIIWDCQTKDSTLMENLINDFLRK